MLRICTILRINIVDVILKIRMYTSTVIIDQWDKNFELEDEKLNKYSENCSHGGLSKSG